MATKGAGEGASISDEGSAEDLLLNFEIASACFESELSRYDLLIFDGIDLLLSTSALVDSTARDEDSSVRTRSSPAGNTSRRVGKSGAIQRVVRAAERPGSTWLCANKPEPLM